jgi:hypothetical protein
VGGGAPRGDFGIRQQATQSHGGCGRGVGLDLDLAPPARCKPSSEQGVGDRSADLGRRRVDDREKVLFGARGAQLPEGFSGGDDASGIVAVEPGGHTFDRSVGDVVADGEAELADAPDGELGDVVGGIQLSLLQHLEVGRVLDPRHREHGTGADRLVGVPGECGELGGSTCPLVLEHGDAAERWL